MLDAQFTRTGASSASKVRNAPRTEAAVLVSLLMMVLPSSSIGCQPGAARKQMRLGLGVFLIAGE